MKNFIFQFMVLLQKSAFCKYSPKNVSLFSTCGCKKRILAMGSLLFLLYTENLFSLPTKIYLMELTSAKEDIEKANKFRKSLQEYITKNGNFRLIDEDTIRSFQEKLKKQQLTGCDDTKCLQEIANALETEELLTGEFKSFANQEKISLKLTTRNSETFEVGIKTTFTISYFENQREYYIKEIIKKLNNPLYSINTSSAPSSGGNGSSTTKLPFLPISERIQIPNLEKKNILDNPTEDNIFYDFTYSGNELLKSGQYESASVKLTNAKNYAIAKKINPETLSLSYRFDLIKIIPLENNLFEVYPSLVNSKEWNISNLKNELVPQFESLSKEDGSFIVSQEGKKKFAELSERIYSAYVLLLGEYIELLYSTNRLEEFASQFKSYGQLLNRAPLTNLKVINYSKEKYKSLEDKYIILEKEYIPAWNLEIQKNCITLYYASRIFPEIQKATKDDYNDTYSFLVSLYKTTLNQITDGKNIMDATTKKSCGGVR